LLYQSDNEFSEIKVADFGVSRFLDEQEMATTAVGTPSYMAPEVCSG
jgi:serine/threonine protein kinase